MPIFWVKSVKIYTGQKIFTWAPLVVLVTNIRYAGWPLCLLSWFNLVFCPERLTLHCLCHIFPQSRSKTRRPGKPFLFNLIQCRLSGLHKREISNFSAWISWNKSSNWKAQKWHLQHTSYVYFYTQNHWHGAGARPDNEGAQCLSHDQMLFNVVHIATK